MALGGCSDTYLRRGLDEDLIWSNLTRIRCDIFFDTLAAETYYQFWTMVEVFIMSEIRQRKITTGSHRERRAVLGTPYILTVLFYDSQIQYINCFYVVQREWDIILDNICRIYSKEAPCHRGVVY